MDLGRGCMLEPEPEERQRLLRAASSASLVRGTESVHRREHFHAYKQKLTRSALLLDAGCVICFIVLCQLEWLGEAANGVAGLALTLAINVMSALHILAIVAAVVAEAKYNIAKLKDGCRRKEEVRGAV